jgi:serine/threonine protein kinase
LGLSGENKYTNFESGSSEYSLLWAAPEVLIGEPNTIKSDVYSLTIVLWEILNPGLQPYYDVEDLSHISDQIICGLRPPLEPANASKPVENKAEYDAALVHSQLSSLFNRGWHADPNERPTAIEFVDCLENIKGML